MKIGIRQLMLHIKIIVKTVLDRRSDRQLHIALWIQALYRLCHNVRGRMAQRMASALILKRQHTQCCILCHRRCQIDDLTIKTRRKCFLRQ